MSDAPIKHRRNRKVATAKSEVIDALPLACSDETAAVEFMERQRWGTRLTARSAALSASATRCGAATGRGTRYLWRCRACNEQYTVRVGTIMEDSPIPLRHWCYAFWAACASKKGVSAKQIQRMTGVSYKSALFLMHRIRYAMATPSTPDTPKLGGTVEVDETYVGGKPRKAGYKPEAFKQRGPQPDFRDRKTPVVAAVQRGGQVRCRVVPDVTAANLRGAVTELVDPSARLHTDERQAYVSIGREFAGGHESVSHSRGSMRAAT